MSDMFCQNKECCYKRNQNQIRGAKGNKVYQSNKAYSYYYDMFCSQGCFHSYFKANVSTIQTAIPLISRQTIGVSDAWEFKSDYDYNYSGGNRVHTYYIHNKLMGINQLITKQQAQTPEQMRENYGWYTRPNSEAKEFAQSLGLVKDVA